MELNHKIIGEGEPIIILHGLFGMLDNWQTVAKELAEDYMVILVDLRNHGKSPHSDDWSIKLMAQDVLDFMHANWIFEATVMGHSMGGKVAMEMALSENDLIKKLIVVDIAPRAYDRGHDLIIDTLNSVPITEIESRNEAEEYLEKQISDWGIRQFLLKNISRNKEGGYRWKMNLPVITENYETILQETPGGREYDHPSLFIAGGNSNYIQPEDKEYIKILFPEAEIKTIEGAGHWVHAEKRQEVVEMVRAFLG